MDKGAILNQLDTTLYEVIQSFTFQHIVLQQSQINKLTNHFIIAGITNKNSFFFTFQIIPFLIQIIQFVFFRGWDVSDEVEIVGIKEETRKVVVTGIEMFRKKYRLQAQLICVQLLFSLS